MSYFHYFHYLTNTLFFSFIPRTITDPMASNASSPKAFHTLAYFISVSLIVFPDCALSFKNFTSYYTQSVGTKNSYVFKTSRRARNIRVVFSFIFDLCAVASNSSLASSSFLAACLITMQVFLGIITNPFIALASLRWLDSTYDRTHDRAMPNSEFHAQESYLTWRLRDFS